MTVKVRVAFTLFGDGSWTGGINYLRNLFSAINSLDKSTIEPVLFIGPNTSLDLIKPLTNFLNEPPIVVLSWSNTTKNKASQLFNKFFLQCDKQSLVAFQLANVDVVFQNDRWYGFRFPLPTLAWIADFQHKHLTEMFTFYQLRKRDLAYSMLCKSATQVMVSSEDAGKDCKHFFSLADNKISVVPFAVQLDESVLSIDPTKVMAAYKLPKRYFYFPGQLWKHKNHLVLLDAISLLKEAGVDVVVVATGNPKDGRNISHPNSVLKYIEMKGLSKNFLFLGMIPYQDIMPLMRGAEAVINPSLFEGWSTIVEEAKALGVPMLLSNLNVHKEQAPELSQFFDPRLPIQIANVIKEAWLSSSDTYRHKTEHLAFNNYKKHREDFAKKFEKVVLETINKR
jgi:glycosyltransferase involved in cell wall biosynthesis